MGHVVIMAANFEFWFASVSLCQQVAQSALHSTRLSPGYLILVVVFEKIALLLDLLIAFGMPAAMTCLVRRSSKLGWIVQLKNSS